MRGLSLLILAVFLSLHSVSAASVQSNVIDVQSSSTYSAPSGYEPKGYVGSIISQIFSPVGRILSDYVLAFQNIISTDNTVPVWNSSTKVFEVGTITDTGTNVGVGVTNPGEKLSVNGRLSVTGNPNSDDDVGDRAYNDGRYVNVGESINGDTIQDGTIDSSEIQNGSLQEVDMVQNQFDDSEIQDNSLTASSLAANSVGNSELNNSQSFTMQGITVYSDATINGMNFGRGGGNSFSNTAIGPYVLSGNSGTYNTAIGYASLRNNSTGRYNLGLGPNTLTSNRTGSYNIGLGYNALRSVTTNGTNIAIGTNALEDTNSYAGVAIGHLALDGVTTGAGNTGVGSSVMRGLRTGQFNTSIGYEAGRNISTGSRNVAIGYATQVPNATASDQLNIANKIYGVGNGNIGIGTSGPTRKLDVNGKIRMRNQTSNSDSNDTVVTKGYVDSLSSTSVTRVTGEISSRNISSALNVTSDVTFYAADQDTANFLCREQLGLQFGYWRSKGTPSSSGWRPYSNLEISAYNTDSRMGMKRLCTSGSDCYNKQTQYGGNLYCYSFDDMPAPYGY